MPDFFDQVLNSTANRICVIAAPESGKTSRILIPKASRVLTDQSIDPQEVLLLTFSRLSAIDLKGRVKTMERVPRASTVHSLCLSFLLAEDNHGMRKRVESILLDFEKETLISDLKLVFPHRRKTDLRKELEKFSAGWATQPHDKVFEENNNQRAFKAAIVSWLSEHEAAMMEEIVYYAVDLARQLTDARFIEDPQYIFVDEFQDLNRLEQEFIEVLAAKSKLVLIVGDPDQSIYSFKYAYPAGIREYADRGDVEDHSGLVTGRCPKSVVAFANQLLRQTSPTRTELLQPLDGAEAGEVHFVQKETQLGEFEFLLRSIGQRIRSGAAAERIIVLVPRKKLGHDFVEHANSRKASVGFPPETIFAFVLKPEFTEKEKEGILLFGLLVKPDSLLHLRAYLGLADNNHFAAEVKKLKEKHGNLANVLKSALGEDYPARRQRIRTVCNRIARLRNFLAAHVEGSATAATILDELFPEGDSEVAGVRKILSQLKEEEDTPAALYGNFVDYIRRVPYDANTVRVMTLMASKGLEEDHVYIMGCNAGNIPGSNRSSHLSDHEHLEEQRRLLYVAFTRAKKSLAVSWSRLIPFHQSRGHYTASVGTTKIGGKLFSRLGISPFLQDLSDVTWET